MSQNVKPSADSGMNQVGRPGKMFSTRVLAGIMRLKLCGEAMAFKPTCKNPPRIAVANPSLLSNVPKTRRRLGGNMKDRAKSFNIFTFES